MAASTALAARSGWSVYRGIRWSIYRGIGGQFTPESGGQYQRILQSDEGKEFLKAQIGNEHFEFHSDTFKEIRTNLKKHRDSLFNLSQCWA